jgi:hypothetical protein
MQVLLVKCFAKAQPPLPPGKKPLLRNISFCEEFITLPPAAEVIFPLSNTVNVLLHKYGNYPAHSKSLGPKILLAKSLKRMIASSE